jgi:hypothetical protein
VPQRCGLTKHFPLGDRVSRTKWLGRGSTSNEKASLIPRSKDPKREHRIEMEIIVDAYGPEEQAMGWYYYLQDKLQFPFRAKCMAERRISPLRKGDEVDIVGMAPEDECEHEMFVETRWEKRTLAVPLSQLKPIALKDKGTKEAVEDWLYWVQQGYEL